MTKYTVIWQGMKEGQEFHCSRLDDAKRVARAYAIVFGHAELTYDTLPGKDIYFDRTPGHTVKELEM